MSVWQRQYTYVTLNSLHNKSICRLPWQEVISIKPMYAIKHINEWIYIYDKRCAYIQSHLDIFNMYTTRPRVHKSFQNQDQDQAQVRNYFTVYFFLKNQLYLFNYWLFFLIQYVLQTRFLGILRVFLCKKK